MERRGGPRSEPWSPLKSGGQREEKEPAQRAVKLPGVTADLDKRTTTG